MILARQTIKISSLAHSTSKIIPRMIWSGPSDSFYSQGGANVFWGVIYFLWKGPGKC